MITLLRNIFTRLKIIILIVSIVLVDLDILKPLIIKKYKNQLSFINMVYLIQLQVFVVMV